MDAPARRSEHRRDGADRTASSRPERPSLHDCVRAHCPAATLLRPTREGLRSTVGLGQRSVQQVRGGGGLVEVRVHLHVELSLSPAQRVPAVTRRRAASTTARCSSEIVSKSPISSPPARRACAGPAPNLASKGARRPRLQRQCLGIRVPARRTHPSGAERPSSAKACPPAPRARSRAPGADPAAWLEQLDDLIEQDADARARLLRHPPREERLIGQGALPAPRCRARHPSAGAGRSRRYPTSTRSAHADRPSPRPRAARNVPRNSGRTMRPSPPGRAGHAPRRSAAACDVRLPARH